MQLPSYQRKYLRELAHALKPIVQIGHEGVSEGVLGAVAQALLDHELIKVRMHDPEDKKGMAAELAERAGACLCGLVGHTAILYRPHPEEPTIALPVRESVS
jgi:RNA-binding protein